MRTFGGFLLIDTSETIIFHFNETPIFMAALMIGGIIAAGSIGIVWYARRPVIKAPEAGEQIDFSSANDSEPLAPGREHELAGKSLVQRLLPDRWIPPSQKIQETPYHLRDRSPWQDHVLPQDQQTARKGSLNALIEKFISDLHLVLKYIWKYWLPYWIIGIVSAVCLMSMPAYQLFAAQKLGMAIDQGAPTLISSAIQLASILPFAFVLDILGGRLSARLSSRVVCDIRHDLFTHLQSLSQDFHKKTRLGSLLAHFSVDIDKMEHVLGQELILGVSEAGMVLINWIILFRINGSLTIMSLFPVLVTLPVMFYLMTNLSKQTLKAANQNALMMDAVQEGIRGQPIISAYGLQALFAGYFSDELRKLEDKKTEGKFSSGLFKQAVMFSACLLAAWVMGIGGLYVLSGTMTLGTWIAFFAISQNMYDALVRLVSMRIGRWVESSIGMQRLNLVLDQPAQVVDAVDAFPLPPFHQKICFEHLSFSYGNTQRQLDELNLSIEAGQFVAFVGSSGAGKSTVFNLLMRFYDACDGRITIDGYDIRHLSQKSLRSQIGVVLQETFLFNTTIMNNIRLAKPDATDADIFAAASAAELHDFVLGLPDGYQTVVGESGGRLSGGQRQRISIARALLHSPPILLLDEPTSSLSAEMADAINETIMALAGQHTVIMITHQLKAAIHADCIFVLDQGRLVEQGTHHNLLDRNGRYRQLWDIQSNHLVTP